MPRYQTKPIEVEAVQLRCSYRFGKSSGRAGDWLVTYDDGRQEIVGAEAFTTGFTAANGDGATIIHRPARLVAVQPAKRPTPRKATPKGKRAQISLETWAAARKEYERGVAPKLIAARLGCVESAIYWRAKHHGWAKPAGKPTPTAKPRGEELGARVRCQSCQQLTGYDPCEYCGAKVAFKA